MSSLTFDNTFVRELPADPEPLNYTRQVAEACYSRVRPTAVAAPRVLAWSQEMAETLGLSAEAMASSEMAEILGGNRLADGMDPYAACYGGHQFGHWAGQLGDGRAISLGEVINGRGERWELQLKGAGLTPYSRTADGRAVMRSSVREFLCSEAMHHLGVPTTRALSLVSTGEAVVRDMFYDGNPRPEPGAVVCRVAPSFLRLGNFEIFAARRDEERLRLLADYALRTHFPELLPEGTQPTVDTYVAWLEEVCRRTAEMVCHWQRVGFVHGVMNTDNLSILGLTIDYGPYGWLDAFDPDWTPNTTDAQGRRYRYGYQPAIAHWNLARFAEALHPLIGDVGALEGALSAFSTTLGDASQRMILGKLGLEAWDDDDRPLFLDLEEVLTVVETDMTLFYRGLAQLPAQGLDPASTDTDGWTAPFLDAYYDPEGPTAEGREALVGWLRRYIARVQRDDRPDTERRQAMDRVNPKYVLRNYIAQLAIDKAEEGDGSVVHELLEVLRHPYDEQPDAEQWAEKRPEWARHRPGCSMLSCSS